MNNPPYSSFDLLALRIVSCARELSEFLLKRAQISEMRPIIANTRPTFAGSTTPHEIFCMVSQATPPTRIEMMLQKISFDFSVFMMPTFLMKKLSFLNINIGVRKTFVYCPFVGTSTSERRS